MNRTLLLVDDEANILHALERVFAEDGYVILTAPNAEEGLKILAKHPVQVIISDYNMPNMSGSAFLRQVKELYPETIRIMLSAYSDFSILKDVVNEGHIYKFFNKPWDKNQLRTEIENAFLVVEKQKDREKKLIKLMNHSRLKALTTDKSGVPLFSMQELQAALDLDQFILYYQPIVDISTGKVKAAEALLRWRHPTSGLLEPDQFIPCCEELGIILPLGAWVLHTACQQLVSWHQLGHRDLSIAVNLSVRQLEDVGLVNLIRDTLSITKAPAQFLELEITETLVMSNIEENITVMQALKNLGIRLSLDDFGTGYSSLSYLNRFPINTLKIDKSFIKDVAAEKSETEIVNLIVGLAKNLGLNVVAEGVEKQEQMEMLKKMQCDYVQGYLIGKPISGLSYTEFLASLSGIKS